MRYRKLPSIFALFAPLIIQPLQAWNNFGHMAVAYVAYKHLNPSTRNKVDHLLTLNPYFSTRWQSQIPVGASPADRNLFIFMLAATWADAIKGDPAFMNDGTGGGNNPDGPEPARNTGYDDPNRHKYWHFINDPFTQDGTALPTPSSPNARTQIDVFRQVLNSNQPEALKSYDLVWLLHVAGDVHQPLHATARISSLHPTGDAGGNFVHFCDAAAPTCTGTLHAFWDDAPGIANDPIAVKAFARKLKVPKVPPGTVGDSGQWIGESFTFAQSSVYVLPVGPGDGPFRSTKQYTDRAVSLAKKQIALAGARLAVVLKTELQ